MQTFAVFEGADVEDLQSFDGQYPPLAYEIDGVDKANMLVSFIEFCSPATLSFNALSPAFLMSAFPGVVFQYGVKAIKGEGDVDITNRPYDWGYDLTGGLSHTRGCDVSAWDGWLEAFTGDLSGFSFYHDDYYWWDYDPNPVIVSRSFGGLPVNDAVYVEVELNWRHDGFSTLKNTGTPNPFYCVNVPSPEATIWKTNLYGHLTYNAEIDGCFRYRIQAQVFGRRLPVFPSVSILPQAMLLLLLPVSCLGVTGSGMKADIRRWIA